MTSLLAAFASTPTLSALLGATALVVGGIALIASAIFIGHEAMVMRVDLIRPRAAAAITAGKKAQASDKGLFRLPEHGLPEREERELIRRLSKLGVPESYALSFFAVSRILAAFSLGVLMLITAGQIAVFADFPFAAPLAAAIAFIAGWFLPLALIRMGARQRAKAVASAMPEALDLLVVCVDAGLSLEDAFIRVVNEMGRSRPELADELALTSADLQILPSREEALARMADRVNIPSVRSVVSTLAQTLRYGTPLAQALRVIASEMRNDALMLLEERANQLPALLTVPMILFIMPTIFLIIGGPAVLNLIDALGW